jgi:aryl-alcohol dehydrogenase
MGPTAAPQNNNTTALVVSTVNGPFEVKDVQLKEMLSDEIVVKIVATGVCHTDIATATVRWVLVS